MTPCCISCPWRPGCRSAHDTISDARVVRSTYHLGILHLPLAPDPPSFLPTRQDSALVCYLGIIETSALLVATDPKKYKDNGM